MVARKNQEDNWGKMTFSPLKIKLLGPIEVIYENQPVKIRRRMERAILYFLAAENRPVSRTTLIDLFWVDEDDIDHRAALRTALSRLRNELPDADILVTELDQVWLDTESCWVDLVEFSNSCDSLRNVMRAYQETSALPAQIVGQVEEALALWRGDALLQGDSLSAYPAVENWRRGLNRKLSHQRSTLMERLAKHYIAAGRLELALDLFVKLGQMDLLNVSFHLSVLKILTEMRRFQEAVDYCDELEVYYEEAFNAPLPEQILQQYQYSQIQLKSSEQSQTSEWPVRLTMQLPLVGRDTELKRLQKAFYHGGIAVITGELGSGKTRLVQELYQSFKPRPILFFAPSQEMGMSMPLSPIIHGLRAHVSREVWESIDCVWANKLSLLLPELTDYRMDCSGGQYIGTPLAKQQLFDAILYIFQVILPGNDKLLFFLDDAQWADRQTLEAISYLIQHGLFDSRSLLVIASRSEEPSQELNEMIDRLHRTQAMQSIHLTGLSPRELSALVNQAFVEPPASKALDQLYRETNGNPFLALEITRNLLEFPSALDQFTATSQLPLPENVHAVIRQRLNRLDDPTREILLCGAVIGNEFPLELLSTVSSPNASLKIRNIDPLIKHGFIHSSGQAGDQAQVLKFTHEVMRKVVLKQASTIKLQEIHHRVAVTLAELPSADEQAALIANHYLVCGEPQSAFQWYLKAAEHSWALGAKEDTHDLYQQAESLYKNGGPDEFPMDEVYQLYRKWGQFAYEADIIDLLEEVGFKLQYLGEQAHNPLFLGVSHMILANACFLRLKMNTGLELISKGIQFLQHTGNNQAMMEAKLRQAAFYWWLSKYDDTIQACQEVLQLGESQISDSQEKTNMFFVARHNICYSLYAKGTAKQALSYARDLYDQYYYQVSTFNRMRTVRMLANTNLLRANYKESEDFAKKGLEIARNLENSFVVKMLLVTLSKAETSQGHMDEAFAHAHKALEMGGAENYSYTVVSANSVLGTIHRHLQNYNLALQHFRVAHLRGGYSDDSLYSIENRLNLARTIIWMGQINEARGLASQAFAVTKRYQMMHLHTMAMLTLGLCDILERKLAEAQAIVLDAEQIALDNGLVYEQTWSKIGQARIALSRRQFDEAEEIIKAILEVSDRHKMAWLKLRGLNFCFQLYNATQKPTLLFCRSEFDQLIKHLSEHTQSDALKQSFDSARQYWGEGHAYP
jgi:DNA-binding SARP family transcriptional activator